MRQKVVIAAALIHRPDVLILDEPLDGLDANTAMVVKELLKQLAAQGKTIMFSSHILDVVERMCTRIVIINNGRFVTSGTAAEIRAREQAVDAGGSVQQTDRRARRRPGHGGLSGVARSRMRRLFAALDIDFDQWLALTKTALRVDLRVVDRSCAADRTAQASAVGRRHRPAHLLHADGRRHFARSSGSAAICSSRPPSC